MVFLLLAAICNDITHDIMYTSNITLTMYMYEYIKNLKNCFLKLLSIKNMVHYG